MISYPTILTAYSNNEYYKHCANRFKHMTRSIKNKVIIESYEDQGSWHANTRKKPEIILKNLISLNQPLIWIDVDAHILKDVPLDNEPDIDFFGIKQDWGPRRTWCVGTLIFNPTNLSIQLLEKWVENCTNNQGTDENSLELAWNSLENKSDFKTKLLDVRYFGLDSLHNVNSNTIIHHKSSGNAKKKKTL